jgi:phosphoglycerate dehydrogenase-like enzyme
MFGVLFFAKRFPEMEENRQARRYKGYDVQEVAGQTIGIVGLGGTGLATARLAKAFGIRVLATKRRPPSDNEMKLVDGFVSPDRLNDLLAASDYVVNALPLTPETRGLFGAAHFRAMKRSGIFINVGRGKTVREDELVEALSKRTIAGAALDVFEKEPLPPESELYELPNVILSPHCADLTGSYHGAIRNLLEENLLRYVSGQPLLNVVDKAAGY